MHIHLLVYFLEIKREFHKWEMAHGLTLSPSLFLARAAACSFPRTGPTPAQQEQPNPRSPSFPPSPLLSSRLDRARLPHDRPAQPGPWPSSTTTALLLFFPPSHRRVGPARQLLLLQEVSDHTVPMSPQPPTSLCPTASLHCHLP